MENNFLFKYDNFESMFPSTLSQLWNENNFLDVTLATADSKQIRVHKVIISSASLFFKEILLRNSHSHPLIYLKDVNYAELSLLMKFIYFGQCEVNSLELEAFLTCANELKISGIHHNVQDNRDEGEEPHLTKSPQNFHCTFNKKCKRVLQTKNKLEIHIQKVHKAPRRYSCEICDKKIRTSKILKIHKKIHKRKGVACDLCGKITKSKNRLEWHKDLEHTAYNPVCYVCHTKFETKAKLRHHQKNCCKAKNKAKLTDQKPKSLIFASAIDDAIFEKEQVNVSSVGPDVCQ